MKKIHILLQTIILWMPLTLLAAANSGNTAEKVTSPDGNYVFSFSTSTASNGDRVMNYGISYKGKTVIEPSRMGVEVENKLFESALGVPHDSCRTWCANMNFIGADRMSKDTVWHPAYGEWSAIKDKYNAEERRVGKECRSRWSPYH